MPVNYASKEIKANFGFESELARICFNVHHDMLQESNYLWIWCHGIAIEFEDTFDELQEGDSQFKRQLSVNKWHTHDHLIDELK